MNRNPDQVLRSLTPPATSFAERGEVLLPASSSFAILTCMDARIDAAKLSALRGGSAHIVRNAGGRASDDAIRSLVMAWRVLGTREWFVVHHSHCGMALLSEEVSLDLLAGAGSAARPKNVARTDRGDGTGSQSHAVIDWVTIEDRQHSVLSDLERIRNHPLVPAEITLYGHIYQVETGGLVEVQQADRPGRS